MNALSRKQREVANRHELFLAVGRTLLREHGYHQLSMDLVAEKAEYSKGTVYQHFSCKEELFIQICNRRCSGFEKIAQLAVDYKGSTRERLLAFVAGHELWIGIEPKDIHMLQNVHTEGVIDKVEPETAAIHYQREKSILSLGARLVQEALNNGDLPEQGLTASELVYGVWSMVYGGQLLRTFSLPFEKIGVRKPGLTIVQLLHAMLDGLDWAPSLSWSKTEELLHYFETDYFHELLTQHKHEQSCSPH